MKLDDRTFANVEVALEAAFQHHPHGGDHETRKRVARKLLQSAKSGNHTLGRLVVVARSALKALGISKAS
jgi:hypothetical protein